LGTAGLARLGLRVHVYSTVFDAERTNDEARPATIHVIVLPGLGNIIMFAFSYYDASMMIAGDGILFCVRYNCTHLIE
jgi:hypothetical protein